MADTDPVTREVIKNALMSIADSMAWTVLRTARSAVVKDGMDFSTALFTADGQQVAQGLTVPSHLGSMVPALEGVMRAFGEDVRPGDIFVNNDPYEGGSHLPDIFVFKPIFVDGMLVGWSHAIGHQTDIGGRVAGGVVCDNREIYQEGLILPPIKLYDQGNLNQAVWRILEKNVRVPHMVLGDVKALLAAVRLGEREFLSLMEQYGRDTLLVYMHDILDTTERLTRAEILALPHGVWTFTDYIDNDGIDMRPIAIVVRVEIAGDEVHVDYEGTSPQAKGSINPNLAYTKSLTYAAMKCLIDPQIQSNSGFFRPFRISAPEGSFVNPQHPAPVAARGMSGFRICNAIFGAMAQALPGKIPAAWGGGEVGLSFSGYTAARKAWIHLDLINDGPRGGGPYADGADGLSAPIHNMANIPVESVEAEQPLIVEQYALIPDTGGPGKYRGGLAIIRDFRVLADETLFQLRSDRSDFVAWGLEGGKGGTPTMNYLNPDGENRRLPGKCLISLKKGDLYRLIQASGGGFGEPRERNVAAVLEDVRQEKMTTGHAKREYGVVIDRAAMTVDAEATASLRAKMGVADGIASMPQPIAAAIAGK